MTKIVLVDFCGTGIKPGELQACANALQAQIQTQFALPQPLGWGITAQVRAAKSAIDILPDEWVCGFWKTADEPGALGYHDKTPAGKPIMKCFPLLDKEDGVPWQPTASHEILETLLDAELNLCFQAPDGTVWAGENSDAVEQDTYPVLGVPLSNWCTPLWYSGAQIGKFDWMGLCKSSFEIRPGGYGQTWDPEKGWQQILNQEKKPRPYRLEHIGRGARRMAQTAKVIR